MNKPLISIILPVYNGEKYIRACIESILWQSEGNFELIIIDDASTDNTVSIIESYKDNRVNLIKKDVNSGYVKSLNLGLKVSMGKYIARMDADDISHTNRLSLQINYLITNPDIDAVGARIKLINEEGNIIGDWKNDKSAKNYQEIKNYLPKANCLCHPSMIIKKEVISKYYYDENQYGSEDWDLWLQLISDGYKIDKIDEILLYYRTLSTSVSGVLDKKLGVKGKAIRVQIKYIKKRIKQLKFNLYDLRVVKHLILNILIFVKSKIGQR